MKCQGSESKMEPQRELHDPVCQREGNGGESRGWMIFHAAPLELNGFWKRAAINMPLLWSWSSAQADAWKGDCLSSSANAEAAADQERVR